MIQLIWPLVPVEIKMHSQRYSLFTVFTRTMLTQFVNDFRTRKSFSRDPYLIRRTLIFYRVYIIQHVRTYVHICLDTCIERCSPPSVIASPRCDVEFFNGLRFSSTRWLPFTSFFPFSFTFLHFPRLLKSRRALRYGRFDSSVIKAFSALHSWKNYEVR